MTRTAINKTTGTAPRLGGELHLYCDPMQPAPAELADNVLAFSHGRAALSWLIARRGPFGSAAICAYTCPSVPSHLAGEKLELGYFDYAGTEVPRLVATLPGKTLVLLPAPFGMKPWLDAASLAMELGKEACVVVDAAQTAFGHENFAVPLGGAVLSCPRKALAIGDGAMLALDTVEDVERVGVEALLEADEASRLKQRGRELLATGNAELEMEALDCMRAGDEALPVEPHRMSEASLEYFRLCDRGAHRSARERNSQCLRKALGGNVKVALPEGGTPFNFPVLVQDRDACLKRLHQRRLFATALWPDAVHDPQAHPAAADLARNIIALPVDQRYGENDMNRIAEIFLSCQ